MKKASLQRNEPGHSLMALILPWFVLLSAGAAYYAFFRSDTQFLPQMLSAGLSNLVNQPDQSLQLSSTLLQSLHMSFPSFVHAAAFTWLIVYGCRRLNTRWGRLLAIHFAFCVVFESTLGTTAIADMFAIVLGTLIATALAIKCSSSEHCAERISEATGTNSLSVSKQYWPRMSPSRKNGLAAVSLSLSTVFTIATGPYPLGTFDDPVYLSYEQLRSSVQVVSPRTSIDASRVYLYDNYLILNERNLGLHVIDNNDPEFPVNIGFIEIPGNTEVSVKRGFLYADSYVDLVTLDIRSLDSGDIDSVREVNRVEDIFPYDEYQNVSSDVSFNEVDRERGVVVGSRSGS